MSCQFKDECPSYSEWCERPRRDFSECIPFLVSAVKRRDEEIKELKMKLYAVSHPMDFYDYLNKKYPGLLNKTNFT